MSKEKDIIITKEEEILQQESEERIDVDNEHSETIEQEKKETETGVLEKRERRKLLRNRKLARLFKNDPDTVRALLKPGHPIGKSLSVLLNVPSADIAATTVGRTTVLIVPSSKDAQVALANAGISNEKIRTETKNRIVVRGNPNAIAHQLSGKVLEESK